MPVKISDRIGTFGETDVYAAQDGNRGALGLHVVNTTSERNAIPIDRRKYTYEASGANATPKPMVVAVRNGLSLDLYWLKNEPGTDTTTNGDWELYVATVLDPFQGFFIPASTTLVNGTGTKGHYYTASVAGSHDFGAGSITFAQYDDVKYDGTAWQKIGGSTAVADWNTMINKPSTFAPSSHTHLISEITGLIGELLSKLDADVVHNEMNDDASQIPTSHAVFEYAPSRLEVADLLSNLVTYGIKFVWQDTIERDAQTGMILNDLGLIEPTQQVFKWNGTTWNLYFTIVAGSGHSIAYTPPGDVPDVFYVDRTYLKFTGSGVTVSDNGIDSTIVTITGGGGGGGGAVDSVNGQTGIVVLDTDDISEPIVPTNRWFTETRVLNTILTGLSFASGAVITAADNVLGALGKIQKQLNDNIARFQNTLAYDGSGLKFSSTDAVNTALTRNTKLFSYTGITHKNDTVELTVLDANTIRILACTSALFWNELFVGGQVSDDAFKSFPQKDYLLTQLITATGGNFNQNPLVTDGLYVRYLGYDKNGNVISSAANFLQNLDVVQLGYTTVIKSGATVTFLGGTTPGARNVFSQPTLASSLELDRTLVNLKSDIVIGYNSGTVSLKASTGSIFGLSINWRGISNVGNALPVDKVAFAGAATVTFASINPLFLASTSSPTPHTLWTELEPLVTGIAINNKFFNTTTQLADTLAANKFSVKRVLVGVRGGMWLQDGEHATTAGYATIDEAKAAISSHVFTDSIVPPGVVTEIARIAFKKGVTDFTNAAQFYITSTFSGAGSGSGSGTASFAGLTGVPSDNTSLDVVLDAMDATTATKLPIAPTTTTGTALTFVTDSIYGSETTPETGNITASTSGAVVGVTNIIIHNSGSAPTFDSKFYKLSGSGSYVLSVKNYIYCTYLSSTRIIYTISQ